MSKLLTVTVAAYNVEKYLAKALDSCVVPEILDDLEVLVISDGSTDETVRIARKYEEKYPQTFRVIEKENGGYGSVVMRGIREAKGKYFRLLDGDDWFDSEGLAHLIEMLKSSEADWVITRLFYCREGSENRELSDPHWAGYEGKTIDIRDVNFELTVGQWHTTMRTQLLREHPFTLPKHTLYTDSLYIVYAMPYVKKIQFEFNPLYCYRIGRDGQSVSRESRIAHADEMMKVVAAIVKYYSSCPDITEENRPAVLSRVNLYYYYGIMTLLLLPPSFATYRRLRGFERRTKALAPDLYASAGKYSKKIRGMRLTGYPGYRVYAGKVKNFF